ncbi:hypothetical protein F4774DRAFT_412087 [Daldinia eschscholtzii]|nr:hypothetical protein F4774DRAFT_412087 [Daldinia eschscholtzii]
MSQSPSQTNTNIAWKVKQREIEEFVKKGLKSTESTVAYLTSPHASGKSTTLISHIIKMILQYAPDDPSPRFIYVLPREVEKNLAREYLEDVIFQMKQQDTLSKDFCLSTYDEFFDVTSKPDWKWPKRVTIVADVELRSSVEGEIFFGLLAGMVHKKREPILSVLLMSPHRSQRTVTAFQKVIDRVQDITVPEVIPGLNIKYIDELDTKEVVRKINNVLSQDERARVVILSSKHDLKNIPPEKTSRINTADQLLDKSDDLARPILAVNLEVGTSARVKNLRLVVLHGSSDAVIFDKWAGHLARCKREVSKHEIAQGISWALKANTSEPVEVLVCMSSNEYNKLQILEDPWSPAWNVDMPQLILRIFSVWKDEKLWRLPTRTPQDEFAFAETLRRLLPMGLVEQGKGGVNTFATTERGKAVLEIIKSLKSVQELDVHSAYLLAVARSGSESDNVGRVMIRMAFISAVGLANFCTLNNQEKDRNLTISEAIHEQCAGVGRENSWKGGLWAALGVYLKGQQDGVFRPDVAQVLQRGCLSVNSMMGYKISSLAAQFEDYVGKAAPANEVHETELSDEEVAAVERHLMWAWLHRVVCFKHNSETVFDVSSCREVQIYENELMETETIMENGEVQQTGGFFAIYNELEVENKGDRILKPRDLTFIPRLHYRDVAKKTGKNWPRPILVAYPLAP